MNFETIVRPFQSANVFPPPRTGTVNSEGDEEPVHLKFGQEGSVKTVQSSGSASQTAFTKTESKEVKRTTVETRVENPNDPSQYVTVEDTTNIEIESGKKDTYEYRTIELEGRQTP